MCEESKDKVIVEVREVWKSYPIRKVWFKKTSFYALLKVSLKIKKGEVVCLLGESGCGKTTLGKIILDLEKPDKGEVFWFGQNLKRLNSKEYKNLRPKIQAVFQDPYSSLNPRYKVKELLIEPYLLNFSSDYQKALAKVEEVLEKVGLGSEILEKYPHSLSGGQRQRVALARTLILTPSLIVLDEPTSALDVTIQAQILNLLKNLKESLNLSYLLITHSTSIALYLADLMVVMYLGKVVEVFKKDFFQKVFHHPYTLLLFNSRPEFISKNNQKVKVKTQEEIPSPFLRPQGCEFFSRCPEREKDCLKGSPDLKKVASYHLIACYKR
ncbi:MAG: ABC transporter ATP-binding protein [Thermodesulfobacteriaceae bacterium]|nr:ABC transporter ATP-binding protein [Thermodesulfobacteriaceae bacterium]MCX8041536.1 ABC transporter ATP-binding protein [Thermodesulfobacteriaceae bacterium]